MSRRSARAVALVLVLVAGGLTGCGEADAPPPTVETPPTGAPTSAPGEEEGALEDLAGEDDEGPVEEAAPPVTDLGPHEVVVVAVHEDPLLRSEQRLLDVIVERMQMRRLDAIGREATDEEATFARARFAGEAAPGSVPSSLASAGTAVILRFPPNRELARGERGTRGIGGVLAIRRGESEPYLDLRIDDSAAWRAPDEQVWPWLISLVRAQGAT